MNRFFFFFQKGVVDFGDKLDALCSATEVH